jgi:myo-inositol-1(or 4)-monophosphatase
MFHLSPLLNILYKLTRNAGKSILRDFSEIERLQSSIKDSQGYVDKSLRNLNKNIKENLSKIKKDVQTINIYEQSLQTCWLVLPVDSEINFSRGIPEFMISIAYKENNKITDCIFYNPTNDEAFFFGNGVGGSKNDFKLRVSEKKKIKDSLISINYNKVPNDELKILERLQNMLKNEEINSRVNNSLFYEFSLLTEGKIDALVFYDSNKNTKEIFSFILKETGGFFIERLCDKENLYLASNKYIGKLVKEMIEK